MTSSRIIVIGDLYHGQCITARSKWVEVDGKNVLQSAYKYEYIIAWMPLPETHLWTPTTTIGIPQPPIQESGEQVMTNELTKRHSEKQNQ